MATQRTLALRMDKTQLIARMELQRIAIAETWREASSPFVSLDRGIHAVSRHRWLAGGLTMLAALAMFVPGRFWLLRTALKVSAIAAPYLIAHRKRGVTGLIFSFLKGRFKKAVSP